ncbi:ATP-binding cassette domain-containing protein [Streptomyces sp. CBMA152]|uniref:ATP-binding cassette domain-containing protein n=1 Tax=Streptomyces sp. CBMA152 TaxID=1896312 RepID=UPI0016600EFE|nr:ATP-binding cassette domain-containing protein [Streptomyces sp. CBMA152]MBD0744611.1 ABC transporter ATP-binding protein [Streptomyces sp. CBMA152]
MLQAIGLTSAPRRDRPPEVDDLTFEALPGRITALLGAPGSGKTMALRLMLELEPGRGVTYFRGRPLHRVAHPAREVGTLLGDVPGHPARTVRGQLRLMCAVAGVPVTRAEEMLHVVGLDGLGDQRLGTLSLGMDRRLGLAAALLGDPHTLVLDEPAEDLSPRDNSWLYGLLRGHADHGGTVLCTFSDPKEAARVADRVVTVDGGRLVADQDAVAFARTRLRPRVAVATPHAARLGALVSREARAARRSVEVVAEDGAHLSVYGTTCAEVGETAFRNGVLVHRLTEEFGETNPPPPPAPRPAEPPSPPGEATSALPVTDTLNGYSAPTNLPAPPSTSRPHITPTRPRTPLRPLRYELRRLLGVRTTYLLGAAVLVGSVVLAVLLGRGGRTPLPHLAAAWPGLLPLPPAAFGAGVLGALAFGEEYRYPALAADRGTVPRRLGLLLAKLAVSAAAALLLAALTVVLDGQALRLVYGHDLARIPPDWPTLAASWAGLTVGCAWAGLLAAGIFRATTAGLAAVLAVPVLVVPLVQKALSSPHARSVAGLPARLREVAWLRWPHELDGWLTTALHLLARPQGAALALSLAVLLCAYVFTGLRGRARW